MNTAAIIAAVTAGMGGLCLGLMGMYFWQIRQRKQELRRITKLTGDILNDRIIKAASSGEETLYAKIEHQLVRVQEQMQGRRDAAEKSRDEIQKLISEIAHQMRTPLANMETYLELLDGILLKYGNSLSITADSLEYVAAIQKSEEKLYFLVESFIKMSRLEHHMIQIKREEEDILKTVRDSLGQIQSRAEAKDIRFKITLPEHVVCKHDSNWLGEAIYNILDNAVKYSEYGGMVEVLVSENEMYLKISVRDYGTGIEEGEENQIFQRFYRGKRVTVQEGFGIGLYLAREIVNRHGGFLVVKRMNQGLMMEISLPSKLLEIC